MRALITTLVLALALPVFGQTAPAPTPGSPEAKAKAREWFHSGGQHYDLGEFAEALHDFKEAYRNYEEPTFLFNIGQCHRQLGQKEQAVRFFRVYLSKVPNASNKVEVKEMINKLETALAQERALVTGKPQGTLSPPESPTETKPETTPEAKPETTTEKPPEVAVVASPAPQPSVAATTTTTVEKSPSERPTPVYKKWWLWTAVAAVVVVGVGIGLGVGLSSSNNTPSAKTDFGTYKPF
jgi:hypothetical protein